MYAYVKVNGQEITLHIERLTLSSLKKVFTTYSITAFFSWRNHLKETSNEVYMMTLYGKPIALMSMALIDKEYRIDYLERIDFKNSSLPFAAAPPFIAFACQRGIEAGGEGFTLIVSKLDKHLITYYKQVTGGESLTPKAPHLIAVDEHCAARLIRIYLKKGG